MRAREGYWLRCDHGTQIRVFCRGTANAQPTFIMSTRQKDFLNLPFQEKLEFL